MCSSIYAISMSMVPHWEPWHQPRYFRGSPIHLPLFSNDPHPRVSSSLLWPSPPQLTPPATHTHTLSILFIRGGLVAKSCLTLCNPVYYNPPGFSIHGDSPGKNTGVGCHALLHSILYID